MCHKGKQDAVVRVRKQADLDMLELAAATGEIDLKFLDESGFCAWSEPGYTYYFRGEQKRLEQTKRRGRRLSIIVFLQPFISFIYGLVIGVLLTHTIMKLQVSTTIPARGGLKVGIPHDPTNAEGKFQQPSRLGVG
ncbi:hypothetical protein [Nostoc sp.]|uniref:hypothetical protein n=1 Tax=Nostoc sp. TaxID=1180 RepID=UPI002FF7DBF5